MADRVKSDYCEVCGRQSRFTKRVKKYGSGMMREASRNMNPGAAMMGGLFKAGGAAVNASKSYRCVTCGSKMGAKTTTVAAGSQPASSAASPPPTSAPAGWYSDPQEEARLRYWDGQQWTGDTAA